ncbi:MAG: hypothetical protein JW891_10570 [Candidatus Lokiarchaeota archaeon]|nr:hypothetical protein [Candidatus Lokiarchaeota archaeon]
MISFHIPWIPELMYCENKLPIPINIEKAMEFVQNNILNGNMYNSSESLFWTVLLLSQMDKIDLITNKNLVKKYIVDLKHPLGGHRASVSSDQADIYSTFYCIGTLKLLGFDDFIEQKDIIYVLKSQKIESKEDGGFIHCTSSQCPIDCQGTSSIKATFYSLSALYLLNGVKKINKRKITSFLKKFKPINDIESFYHLFCLILLEDIEGINIDKKIQKLKIFKLGLKISDEYPSVEYLYWAITLLGLIGKLKGVDFRDLIHFLKTMQQDNGGFTNQYTSISVKEQDLVSSTRAILVMYYIWNEIIDMIETEIVLSSREKANIYFFPISKNYLVSPELVKNIANWLISNKWLEGTILDKESLYDKYLNFQNIIPREIITKLMEFIIKNPKSKQIDLNEFSKQFSFSNALERVKLVINDLLINNFLMGNIQSSRKKSLFVDFAVLKEYIHLESPVLYREILGEKMRIKDIILQLRNIQHHSVEYIDFQANQSRLSIDSENIFEAKEKVNEMGEYIGIRTRKIDSLIYQVKSNHRFVNSTFVISNLELDWEVDKKIIQGILKREIKDLVEEIKEKEEYIAERTKKSKEFSSIDQLENQKDQVSEKLRFLIELTEKKASEKLAHTLTEFIKKANLDITSKISAISPTLKFDTYKKRLEEVKNSWNGIKLNAERHLDLYEQVIKNRKEVKKYISSKILKLQHFFDDNSIQIISLINNNELKKSSDFLNERNENFKNLSQVENEAFFQLLSGIEQKVEIFSNYSSDLKINWDEKLKEEEVKWKQISEELGNRIYSGLDIVRREELFKKLDDYEGDLKWLMENLKLTTEALIKVKNFNDAETKRKEMQIEINQKLKIYDRDFKLFLQESIEQFSGISEIEKELITHWENEKEKISVELDEIEQLLARELDTTGSIEKKSELSELISSGKGEIEKKITQLEANYSEVLKFKRNIGDFELKFNSEVAHIKNLIKSLDDTIKDYIKLESRNYKTFKSSVEKEIDQWKSSKSSIELSVDTIFYKISEIFFIKKVEYYVNAFKGKRIDLHSLSEMMKVKPKQLKLKLIDLISNARLFGELDSKNNTLRLMGQLEELSTIKKNAMKDKIIKEKDPIKKEILGLRYIIVIHNQVGATIYNRKLGDWQVDSDLIGGFLTAIQDFSLEIKKKRIPIEKMAYQEFEIMLEQGENILVALFIDGKGSEWIREKQKIFVTKFEKYYKSNLKNWRGELTSFSNAGYLVDEVFELYRV